jgi:Xaa-Pro aminopeptidase
MITYRTEPFDFNAALDLIEPIGAQALGVELDTPPFADFPGDEFQRRYARLQALMRRDGIDVVLPTQEENVRYFTGYLTILWMSRFRPVVGILPADVSIPAGLAASGQERGNIERTSWVKDFLAFSPQAPPIAAIVEELQRRDLHRGRIGIELGFGQRLGMNQEQLDELVRLLPDAEIVDATPLMVAVRMLKSEAEIARLQRASQISLAGVEAGWRSLRAGLSEREVVGTMATAMFAEGAEVGHKGVQLGIMSGDRWRLSNAVPSGYVLKDGDLVLVDGGASYRGYVCDLIRQAKLGPTDAEQQRWFDAALASLDAAVAAIRPGVPAHAVYDAALASLAEHGLAEHNRMNIIGHGVGADIHELPWVGERDVVYTSDTRLREGMVLSIEPGLLPPADSDVVGHFILEEVVAVTATGTRLLTDGLSKDVWIATGDYAKEAS